MIFIIESKKSKIILIMIAITVIGIFAWNIYQIYFVPKACYRPMIYYNNSLLWDVNVVARKDEETGLRLKYIGTVNSLVHETEKPVSDFECNNKVFMNAKLYRDTYGNYYIVRVNGDLILLETSPQK